MYFRQFELLVYLNNIFLWFRKNLKDAAKEINKIKISPRLAPKFSFVLSLGSM